jgi:putative holliday junction resolvase
LYAPLALMADGPAKPRTLLGFDFGLRRIGVAVGQELTSSARPLATLAGPQSGLDWEAVGQLIDTWQPDALVVGVPRSMDDTEHELTRAAERFARRLHARYRLPVHTVDERLSSVEAERRLSAARRAGMRRRVRREEIDSTAAQVILEDWLRDAKE